MFPPNLKNPPLHVFLPPFRGAYEKLLLLPVLLLLMVALLPLLRLLLLLLDPLAANCFCNFDNMYDAPFTAPTVNKPLSDCDVAARATTDANAVRMAVGLGGVCRQYRARPWIINTRRMFKGSR